MSQIARPLEKVSRKVNQLIILNTQVLLHLAQTHLNKVGINQNIIS